MGKQIFQITGMTQDVSPSKFPADKAFKIKNMRLTAQEDTQLLSLTSEKGNSQLVLSILDNSTIRERIFGEIVGYYTILNYLVLFTHDTYLSNGNTINQDYIYRLEYTDNKTKLSGYVLYSGDLGFANIQTNSCTYGKLETTGYYESENVIKVYWIDGVHQPRFINIAGNNEILLERREYLEKQKSPFDFTPELKYTEEVVIDKNNLFGIFPSGTIQYILTYFNTFGAQTKPFYVSPIYYTSPDNRGGSPEETVGNSFTITIANADETFDYIRAYSIIRTSNNGTPICRCLGDFQTKPLNPPTAVDITTLGASILDTSWTVLGETVKLFKWHPSDGQNSAYVEEVSIEPFKDKFPGISSQTYTIPYHNQTTDTGEDWSYIIMAKTNASDVGWYVYFPMLYITTNLPYFYITFNYETGNARIYLQTDSRDSINGTIAKYYFPSFEIPEGIIKKENITIVDTNTTGYTVDANEVLYVGGTYIVPQTMEQLNNILFFGNYKYDESSINQDLLDSVKEDVTIEFYYKKPVFKGNIGSIYQYNNQLNYSMDEISSFKGGETYTFGLVLQNKYGEWSSVIPLNPVKNEFYPKDSITQYQPIGCRIKIGNTAYNKILENFPDCKRVKVVLSDTIIQSVLCQGVLCPTVFNKQRKTNNPYAQSSWFFRPNNNNNIFIQEDRHYESIRNISPDRQPVLGDNGILQANSEIYGSSHICHICDYPINSLDFFIDKNIITLNCPDIELGDITLPDSQDVKLRIIGILPITSCSSSEVITTESISRSSAKGMSVNITKNNIYKPILYNNISYNAAYTPITMFSWNDYYAEWPEGDAAYSLHAGWFNYPVYPWHRTGNLSVDFSNYYDLELNEDDDVDPELYTKDPTNDYGKLKTKVMANLRTSSFTHFLSSSNIKEYAVGRPYIYHDDSCPVLMESYSNDTLWKDMKMYFGDYDRALVSDKGYYLPYINDGKNKGISAPNSIITYNTDKTSASTTGNKIISNAPITMQYKSTPHAVMQLPSTNNNITILPYHTSPNGDMGKMIVEEEHKYPFWRQQLSNRYYSFSTIIYDGTPDGTNIIYGTESVSINDVSYNIPYLDIKLDTLASILDVYPKLGDSLKYLHIYMPSYTFTYDGVSINCIWTGYKQRYYNDTYIIRFYPYPFNCYFQNLSAESVTDEYSQYYSTPFNTWFVHYVDNNTDENKLLSFTSAIPETSINGVCKYWYYISNIEDFSSSVTYIQDKIDLNNEVYVDQKIKNCYSLYLGELYYDTFPEIDYKNCNWVSAGQPFDFENNSLILATTGDTYYQRYDCLKTYPRAIEDQNQIIEIFSFMCETKINIDGRYDLLRGMADNTIVTNTNFNQINSCYTQKDNIISHSVLNDSFFNLYSYPNSLIWSNTKLSNSLVDNWTHINSMSSLLLNGEKGSINALKTFNNRLYCFQDDSIALIHYNERTAITPSDNVPIEIANGDKVSGYMNITDNIGCKNKYSVLSTPYGLYFADSKTKDLYIFGQGMKDISKVQGMNTFMYNNFNFDSMHTDYDEILKSVYFIDDTYCLLYDEQMSTFVSFFDYNKSDIFNFDNTFLSLHKDNNICNVWKQFSGDYNTFYGVWKPFGIEYIVNDNPLQEKIFTNLEYESDMYDSTNRLTVNNVFDTFDTLSVENEYQSGSCELVRNTNLQKKFRIWRANLPRVSNTLQRFRNPWIKLKLYKNINSGTSYKTVLHNSTVYYV